MSIGMVLLSMAAILVFFGVAQRVLDRMYLSDRGALLLIALMFFGTLLPDIHIGNVAVNLGGAVIPTGICVYLLVRAGTGKERLRAIVGAALTGALVYTLSAFVLPDEPEQLPIDPMYLNGIVAGVIAYALGRSRRGAFICGVLGVLLADIAAGAVNYANGIRQTLHLGGAGIFDAMMIAGLLAVVLAELVGEVLERLARGNRKPVHSVIHQPTRGGEKR